MGHIKIQADFFFYCSEYIGERIIKISWKTNRDISEKLMQYNLKGQKMENFVDTQIHVCFFFENTDIRDLQSSISDNY